MFVRRENQTKVIARDVSLGKDLGKFFRTCLL